jgi:hypothetical protein
MWMDIRGPEWNSDYWEVEQKQTLLTGSDREWTTTWFETGRRRKERNLRKRRRQRIWRR